MAPIVGCRSSDSRDGGIAQLGERVVRNDEVGGSIPPGSTSLRRLRQLRLGKPSSSEGCRVVARRAKTGRNPNSVSRQTGRPPFACRCKPARLTGYSASNLPASSQLKTPDRRQDESARK